MGNESGEIRALRSGAYQWFPFYVALLKGKDFLTPFHLSFYWVLDAFAHGRIKRLIVTMPPQHGKSEGTTRLLPAYMLGLDPDLRIARTLSPGNSIVLYSASSTAPNIMFCFRKRF